MQTAKESVKALHSLLTRRKRFTQGVGNGLDIAYVTDRVIVCSFPYELPLFFSRNNASELIKFLEQTHKDHYKVYNLCAERKYDPVKFKGRVAEFPVNVNEAPQLFTIYSFIKDVNKWLDTDPMNVVCIHCDNGRDRSGMMVSAWLLQTKRCLTASHSITFFASVRGGIAPCVTIPSQPPWFSISKLNKSIFYSKSLEGKKGKMTIDFECNFIQLQGDIVMTFFDGKFSRLMFRISLHTSFIRGKTVTFYPRDIDGPHADVNHKNFNPEFKVTLHFSSVALLPTEQIASEDIVPQSKKYSFDDVLANQVLGDAFRNYLLEYKCNENLDFWRNVQRYKSSYVPSVAKHVATKMYHRYIQRYGQEEVNISHDARIDVEQGIECDVPSPTVFALAEKEIYSLMRNDSYPRFIISDLFFKACTELSDYAAASSSNGRNPRPYANTTPNSSERFPLTKKPSKSTSETPPSASKLDLFTPFKKADKDKITGKKQDLINGSKRKDSISPRTEQRTAESKGKDPMKQNNESTTPPRKNSLSKQDQLAIKKGFRSDSPTTFLGSSSAMHHDSEKRGDFIKGEYRSINQLREQANCDAELSRLQHLDLSSPQSPPKSSNGPTVSFAQDLEIPHKSSATAKPAAVDPQNIRSLLKSNNKFTSSTPDLTQFSPPPPPSVPFTKRLPSTSQPQRPSTSDIDTTKLRIPSSPLPSRPPTPVGRPATPDPSGNVASPLLLRKNLSQSIQSLLPSPPSRPPSSSIVQSASSPNISVPQARYPDHSTAEATSPTRSPSSSFIQYIPPRPETPSGFSPSVLSFDRSIPHELPKSQLLPPTMYPAPSHRALPEQVEPLKVMEDMKLVCVSCRRQLGNKDVVVSIKHHYYHWGCVRCEKCNMHLSSDCVISGDKPYCGKCEDSFFNKCAACGLSITETAEEQRIGQDGKPGISIPKRFCRQSLTPRDYWHRRCFSCCVCRASSNSENRIERYVLDNKLYCVFHHPEPKTIPVNSEQDLVEDSEFSLDPFDDLSEDDGPLRPSSPPLPPPTPTFRTATQFQPIETSRPLPVTPIERPKPQRTKGHKPLPPLPKILATVMNTPLALPPVITPSATCSTAIAPRHFNTVEDTFYAGSCYACGRRIPKIGQLLLAGTQQYHPSCFTCSVCATPIIGAYQDHEGAVFCPRHPVVTHARRLCCVSCNKAIVPGQYLQVGDDKYHTECFGCKLCGLQFGTLHSYYDLWGGYICVPCYDATWELKTGRARMQQQ